ncbi:hypothetical protein [Burkholderia sp. BCC1996]|uniref:hypothetical protein n=1 Tax=unclassified Burkholderia TaxID=2613784 RepID=UPI0039EE0203
MSGGLGCRSFLEIGINRADQRRQPRPALRHGLEDDRRAVPPNPDLRGIDAEILRQANSLRSIMLENLGGLHLGTPCIDKAWIFCRLWVAAANRAVDILVMNGRLSGNLLATGHT